MNKLNIQVNKNPKIWYNNSIDHYKFAYDAINYSRILFKKYTGIRLRKQSK